MDYESPGLAREYLSHPAFGDAVARLGTWVLTAARVPRPVFDELTGRGAHVTQAFGMIEGLFLFTPLGAPADLRAETVGVPVSPLDEIRVLRPGTEVELAEGETGELAARGPYTIRGYLAAPDRDREAFTAQGFYRFRRPRTGVQVRGDAELLNRGPRQGPCRPRR